MLDVADRRLPVLSRAGRPVSLLDEDPDLGEGLDAAEFEQARHVLVVPAETLAVGPWSPAAEPGALGQLVLSGLLVRELRLGSMRYAELLGPGDVIRPWQEEGEDALLPWSNSWRVLEHSTLAVLRGPVARLAARWPQVSENLTARVLERARRQGVAASIPNVVRIQDRLVILFLHLAERWGHVRPDGIVVRLPLTHELIGRLAGARRPSVTTALTALGLRGVIVRREHDEWFLSPEIHDAARMVVSGSVVALDNRDAVAV